LFGKHRTRGASVAEGVTAVTNKSDVLANWKAADMVDYRQWMIELHGEQVDEIDRALYAVLDAGITIETLARGDFSVPAIDAVVPEIHERLENGRGVVVLRGLPAERYSKAQLRLIFWALGLRLGTAVSQSRSGELMVDLCKFGGDALGGASDSHPWCRGLGFRTDCADVVASLVCRAAKKGGLSVICSSLAIRDAVASIRPDLLEVLYQPFWWSWKGRQGAGERPCYAQPVYSENDGRFSSQIDSSDIATAYEEFAEELPPLSGRQIEALTLVNTLANDARFQLSVMFEPGDIQLLNNHVVYHARTDFEDYGEEARRHHLLRMWLSVPNSRSLSPFMLSSYRDLRGGAVRGGFPARTNTPCLDVVQALGQQHER
jgi:hypothetical protein